MQQNFLLGVNYWPRKKAMYWWKNFDEKEVKKDFFKIQKLDLKLARIFLLWEDFQPKPNYINKKTIADLAKVIDIAEENNLQVISTLFTGHMSGPNWIPEWALDRKKIYSRLSISKGKTSNFKIKNMFEDNLMLRAQMLQIERLIPAFCGRRGIFAWDLSNELHNLEIQTSGDKVKKWCDLMTGAIKRFDRNSLVTCGSVNLNTPSMQPKNFLANDFVSVHSYSYFPLKKEKEAEELLYKQLPFEECKQVAKITKRPVLLEETGFSTAPKREPSKVIKSLELGKTYERLLINEEVTANYYKAYLKKLPKVSFGMLAWCWSDYVKELWDRPAYKTYIFERYFGVTRADGSIKPSAKILEKFGKQ